jgi:hypothetical protein
MSFSSTENKDLKIHIKKKTKMDNPLDAPYYTGKGKQRKLITPTPLPNCLPSQSFLWILSGPPRSGKSSYIESLISTDDVKNKRQSYKGLFNRIIFVTPQISDFENDAFNELPDVYNELTLEVLDEIEAICQEEYDNNEQTLIVFDDMGSKMRESVKIQKKLENLCFNHRHMGCSIFFCVQTYVSLSPGMRKSCRLLTLFAMDTMSERDMIFNDLPIRKEEHDELYKYVFDNKTDNEKRDKSGRKMKHTLFIDKSKLRRPQISLYKNFDLIEMK